MERILTGLAIANGSMGPEDYIRDLKRLGVIVKIGAQKIILAMPGSRDLERQVQVVEARRALGDAGLTSLVDIAEVLSQECGCSVIAPHLVPVACTEIVLLWKRLSDFRYILMFHEPVEVNKQPSILCFERTEHEIVISHTNALGSWDAPETLFAACMPVITPTRRPVAEPVEEESAAEESFAVLA